jgi:hypothetical protein
MNTDADWASNQQANQRQTRKVHAKGKEPSDALLEHEKKP